MRAINLKTEFLDNPIGINIQNPRLMWNCEGGAKQSAYRITAAENGKVIWQSEAESDSMSAVYPNELHSRERVAWNVTLKDENGIWGEASEDAYTESEFNTKHTI